MERLTRDQADAYITARWKQQSDAIPTFANDIPLALYLRANRRHVMEQSFADNAASPFVQRARAGLLPAKALS